MRGESKRRAQPRHVAAALPLRASAVTCRAARWRERFSRCGSSTGRYTPNRHVRASVEYPGERRLAETRGQPRVDYNDDPMTRAVAARWPGGQVARRSPWCGAHARNRVSIAPTILGERGAVGEGRSIQLLMIMYARLERSAVRESFASAESGARHVSALRMGDGSERDKH